MSHRRKIWIFIYIVGFAVSLLTVACISKRPSMYQSWAQQLNEAPSKMFTMEDVSFLLGATPTHCDSIEPAPIIGIQFKQENLIIMGVAPKGAAAVAGMKTGEQILKVNGVNVEDENDFLATIRPILTCDKKITIQTNRQNYSITPKCPDESKQCYWEVRAGIVGEERGSAYVNQYGGVAGHKSTERQRFFRASCRICDGYVVNCKGHFQE